MVALARRHPCRYVWHLMVADECAGEGELPRRSGHSATALPDGRVLVFGGIDETGAYRNDAFLVDPDRNRWLALKGGITRGAPPKPRAYHRSSRTIS
jgi:Galactose oxidase, central domain